MTPVDIDDGDRTGALLLFHTRGLPGRRLARLAIFGSQIFIGKAVTSAANLKDSFKSWTRSKHVGALRRSCNLPETDASLELIDGIHFLF